MSAEKSEDLLTSDDENTDVDMDCHCREETSQPQPSNSFLTPFRLLSSMPAAYPNLFVLYKILLSLPVTNCSAERAMSRLKLVKSRLRASMSDSWLNSLMILSAECDVVNSISVDKIIDRFARSSSQLSSYLL